MRRMIIYSNYTYENSAEKCWSFQTLRIVKVNDALLVYSCNYELTVSLMVLPDDVSQFIILS